MTASAAALLLIGWFGLYQVGVPVWVRWGPDPPRTDKANVAADAEARRKAQEAEQQRLREEEQRQAKGVTDAEAKLKAAEAEQQRLKEEVQLQTKAAADAEAKRKTAETEQQRLKEEVQRQTRAAADAEAKRKAAEAEQQRLAADAEAKRKAAEAEQQGLLVGDQEPFSVLTRVAVNGEEYQIIRGLSAAERCSDACAKDRRCKMFAYWNSQICYLFDKRFSTYPNSAAVVGVHKSR